MRRVLVIYVTLGWLFCSCSERDIALRNAIDSSGDNCVELQAVLRHYEDEVKRAYSCDDNTVDLAKQKLCAAKFMIRNMPGHNVMIGKYREYYNISKNILRSTLLTGAQKADSLKKLDGIYKDSVDFVPACSTISADYLIKDIDAAFVQWKQWDWAKHLDFDTFCEYLLPFMCSSVQPISDWRFEMKQFAYGSIGNLSECYDYQYDPRAAITSVNTMLRDMVRKQSRIIRPHAVPIFDDSLFVLYPYAASCEENAEIVTQIMRSKGLPVTIDYTPQWPDRHGGHTWCVFWSVFGKPEEFNPFYSNPGYPFFKHQRVAKVFRRTYSVNNEFRKKYGCIEEDSVIVGAPFFRDVTDEYMSTTDVEVALFRKTRKKVAYIAVFDNFSWHSIWCGKVNRDKATFEKMGRDVTYIVLSKENDTFVPLSFPFRLDRLGNVRYYKPDNTKNVDFRLLRKFPMHQHVYLVSTLRNGIFEASNDLDNWDTIAILPKWPLTSGEVSVQGNTMYRYWRFRAIENKVSDMAEMFMYMEGDSAPCDNYVIIQPSNGYKKLYDGDPLTYYSAKGAQFSGCVDFGKPVNLDKIEYVLRGDGNAIVPGDEYEVSWWNIDHWELIDNSIANDIYLDISSAPAGALYYIKNLSRGIENRIFEWDADKQKIAWD